ncbi:MULTISPECIES: phosphoribosylanthranilate isomerase [unclassified Ruegeria]|uniref:phosphoribosylanthranilate isomerase n=1 Tax=unclassified Ruegeria TaxID=2625375 RepID=UPI001ADB4DEC|nr:MULTISPECIES: phosphoribosylanthranilate isomerase [unclassified Ruegeria]MBO9409967.1 phosphoribosylanthranilate isomerase [Ruegeria sp. R8_1]MBO9414814.1 phosphoribosylanthranilate isomerase [Ruegeria sp. R8_2]
MSDVAVKICGLTAADHVRAAADAGARYLGFNFFPKSPRYVSPEQAAQLTDHVPVGVAKVALVVNASDTLLDSITAAAPFDMIQLHGSESVERVQEVKARYGLPVIKVVGVADAKDLQAIYTYSDVADQLLVDAKAPKNAVLPGGNGLAFDWRLLAGRKYWRKPWMLAGGLNPDNVAEAIRMTGARQVDVASGVESAPGIKDADLMRAFIAAANATG